MKISIRHGPAVVPALAVHPPYTAGFLAAGLQAGPVGVAGPQDSPVGTPEPPMRAANQSAIDLSRNFWNGTLATYRKAGIDRFCRCGMLAKYC